MRYTGIVLPTLAALEGARKAEERREQWEREAKLEWEREERLFRIRLLVQGVLSAAVLATATLCALVF